MKKDYVNGIAGIALILAMALAACSQPTGGGGGGGGNPTPTPKPKSIKITGITETNTDGQAGIHILTTPYFSHGPNHIAREVYHTVNIINGEVYVDLKVSDGYDALDKPWTGSGKYYIFLLLASSTGWSDDGGGQNHFFGWAKDGQIAKYDIQDTVTTLKFSQFKRQ
jgi:hypothetical protein